MEFVLYALITVLGLSSYAVALVQMRYGNYRPNTFSRGIWCLLAVNSMAGLILSHASTSSLVLNTIMLVGSVAVFIGSINKGRKTFGVLEKVCVLLLLISLVIWVLFSAPLVNVCISLVAHFIGALPTYRQVWLRPNSENKAFWLLFAMASLLSVAVAVNTPLIKLIVPLYFVCFDGSMFVLSMRKSGHLKRIFAKI